MVVSLILGAPMGLVSAAYKDRAADHGLLVISLALISVPVFWLGTMLLIAGGLYLHSFPLGGFSDARSLILPTLTLALGSGGYYSRILHTSLGEVMGQDYIHRAQQGAVAAGGDAQHAMANALLPLVTLAGLDSRRIALRRGSTETVFNWPGIGRLAFEAIFNLDIPLIMGTVLFSAFLIVIANLLVDCSTPGSIHVSSWVKKYEPARPRDGTHWRSDGAGTGDSRRRRTDPRAARSDPSGGGHLRRTGPSQSRLSTGHRHAGARRPVPHHLWCAHLLIVGIAGMLVTMTIGVAIGLAAGFFRGAVDTALMRFTDVMLTLPPCCWRWPWWRC